MLKELANNIKMFELGDGEADQLVTTVVADFINDYWNVSLPERRTEASRCTFPILTPETNGAHWH